MQRGERSNLADLGEDVLVDEGGIAKVPTALNDTVANALDLDAVSLEVLQDDLDGDLVVGELDVLGHLLGAVGSVGEGAAGKADALAGALCGHLVGLGIDDLILKGRRSCVDDLLTGGVAPPGYIRFNNKPKRPRARVYCVDI